MQNHDLENPWLDVTQPLSPLTRVYPGDDPVRFTSKEEGGFVTSSLSMSVHAGTHMDAPKHAGPGTQTMDDFPVSLMTGTVMVVDARSAIKFPNVVPDRVFIRLTNTPEEASVKGLPLALYQMIQARGAKVVGVDTMSVDSPQHAECPVHHQASYDGVWVIENLNLSLLTPGLYECVLAPLPLSGLEASPVRVLCRALK